MKNSSPESEPEQKSTCYIVPEEWNGKRLDLFLAHLDQNHSRSHIQRLITKQLVKINKRAPKASHLIKTGENIFVEESTEPLFPSPEDTLPVNIIYEDDEILVVNKPANMTVHPVDMESTGTLVQALLFHSMRIAEVVYDANSIVSRMRPGIVHRLDKNTTGLIVIAKTTDALYNLSDQFKNHTVKKEYAALVMGMVSDSTTIHTNIGRKPNRQNMMGVPIKDEYGRDAITHFEPTSALFSKEAEQDLTLLKCRIETGRTHQIRVHCKYFGHPIIGDPLYCTIPTQKISKLLGAKRQMLHAQFLELTHPRTGERCSFKAPLPEDMLAILTKLQAPDSLVSRG
jgi:23S rRNA pseudouridine1911/1915/1917 synthase